MGKSRKTRQPARPPKKGPTPPPKRCLNCGQELHGEYCSHCGQEHIERGVPGGEMLREFLKDEFHFDFRIVRTIIPLLFRPGFIPAEYVAGRRVRYSPPLRTYVFISFILFALIAVSAKKAYFWAPDQRGETAPARHGPIELRSDHGGDSSKTSAADSIFDFESIKDSLRSEIAAAEADTTRRKSKFETDVSRGVARLMEDREKFFEHLLERSAQAMFLLMPIFALLLKLLYIRRKRQYLEHLVFALNVHSHAFLMFLTVVAGNLTGWAWLQPWLKWPLIAIPLYLFLGMKKFYHQGWGKTLAKYLLLLGAYAVILLAAGIAVLVASVVW